MPSDTSVRSPVKQPPKICSRASFLRSASENNSVFGPRLALANVDRFHTIYVRPSRAMFDERFDVIVIGAGHAGCEAASAAARLGAETALVTLNLDLIGQMSCNPAVGGIAKGHVVREIDALGGIMGRVTDRTGIQFRLLNRSRGPAVQSPRAQADRGLYRTEMRRALEATPNLSLRQGTVVDLSIENNTVIGIELQ